MHAPLQFDDAKPVVLPYRPPGHTLQLALPAKLYCPAAHANAVAFVDPAAHTYPAAHVPLHDDTDRPVLLPKWPTSHGPLQLDDVSPNALPYRPAGHALHVAAPPTL